ncbi:MAG: hypothetical protein ACI35S_05775 [Anaeroplasma sp.]
MKKKKVALLSLAVIAGLSLASCSKDPVESSTTDNFDWTEAEGKGLDIAVNYSGKQGITLRQASFQNIVENVNYVQGNLLPTWKAFAQKMNTEIRDASSYSASTDNEYYTKIDASNYVSETDQSKLIDLFYNSTSNINKMGQAGKAVNLLDHLDKMPNFKKFLEENPSIKAAMMKGNAIYYTPYFDGYNAIERMFVMDTNMVKLVLDGENKDTNLKSGKDAAANTLQATKYTPFMNPDYNYPDATTKVTISKNAKTSEITIKRTTNIIKQQNELLANGATGKQLADQFKAYLDVAFEGLIGAGKTYENYSDIFVSESAAYNADELVALMRLVKASPKTITGDENTEIEIMVPRGVANNRVDNIADLLQIWGIQGMTSEYEMLYFDANGKLNDAASTPQTYEGLQLLSALYDEGLILKDFWDKSSTLGSTGYLNKYFGKTADNGGYGFMLYDYSASTGAVNTVENGIGTANDKRVGEFKDTSVTGVMPVLPPLSYWGVTTEWNHDQALTNHTGKKLLRYAEENRALKSTSWCIPTTSDNIDLACKLMDYLLSEEGTRINDFGPSNYWEAELGTYAGAPTPIMNSKMKEMIAASGTDFWSYMRGYIGATHGVGYVRSASINYQATNKYAQIGTVNIENAIASGAVTLALVDKYMNNDGTTKYTWDTTVPTAGYGSVGDKASQYDAVTSFWSSDKCAATPIGWVKVVIDPYGTYTNTTTSTIGKGQISQTDYSYKDVQDQISARKTVYLYEVVRGLDRNLIPDYAKPAA